MKFYSFRILLQDHGQLGSTTADYPLRAAAARQLPLVPNHQLLIALWQQRKFNLDKIAKLQGTDT